MFHFFYKNTNKTSLDCFTLTDHQEVSTVNIKIKSYNLVLNF